MNRQTNSKGITLIALVITIVVLLILAGVSISMLTGDNGIITQAQKSKEETRGGSVEEERDLWVATIKMDEQANTSEAKTLDELLEELKGKNLLNDDEVAQIKEIGYIQIGSHVIDFSKGLHEIDWSQLEPGLYETGTKKMIKSWEQLKEDGDITVADTTLKSISTAIEAGDLIISREITELKQFGVSCGSRIEITGLYIPNSISTLPNFAFGTFERLKNVKLEEIKVIENYAFYGCDSLKSITIPSTVTSIGTYAFEGCTGLTGIKVDDNNNVYDSRENCNAIIETATNTLIYGCENTIIPNDVINIENNAFYGCGGLTSIAIPNNVTNIGDSAFCYCSSLTSITIPSSVTSIGVRAFNNCSSLTSITISSGVTIIGDDAFCGCENLTSIIIPDSVTSIGEGAFSYCCNLLDMKVDSKNLTFDSRNDCNAIIETTTNKLISGCKNTIIPSDVISIGDEAFAGCRGLTSITIPNSVTSIGPYAFSGCTGLTSITIPDSVTSIGSSAFSGCTGLTSITIPDSVTSIESRTFYGCTGLTSITIPNSVTSIESMAFSSCTELTSITIPDSVTSIGSMAFDGCTVLASITIPNSVTSIGNLAFRSCSSLVSITIPNSVTSMGESVFSEWTSSQTINVPFNSRPSGWNSGWNNSCKAVIKYLT